MVKIPDKIKEVIEKYLKLLKINQIPIECAFLFGSYAKGEENEYSDIDIALVSKIFEGKRISDRGKVRKITLSISSDLEIMPFHPKDFNKDNPFAKEIIESGIKIV